MTTLRMIAAFFLWPLLASGAESVPIAPVSTPRPPEINATAYILVDFNTGTVLAE